jgi:hypothetical protein
MDIDKAFSNVFEVFMALPNAEQQLSTGRPVPLELLLNIPTVSKELFGLEPGCVVHYSAIKEKLQLLGPHMQKTSSGPELMKYFAELRKTRNKWAVAFANYQSQMMTKVVLERSLYGRILTADERNPMPGPAWKVCSESLTIVTQQLLAIKTSREFAEKVRILEECTKQYTTHSRLKAVADRAAVALAQQKQAEAEQARVALAKQKQEEKRKKQAEARKAKKAAAQAATKAAQKNNRIQSVFNPDMPNFAQFRNQFANFITPPSATNPTGTAASIMGASVAATGSSKKATKRVSNKTSPAAKLTGAGVKKQQYGRKVGSSPGSRAGVNSSAAQVSASPAANQSPANSYTAQGPFNPHAAQFSTNPSATQGPINPCAAPGSGNNLNTPALGNIAKVYISPTEEPFIMEQQDFGDFVKASGYPLPNCFVGPFTTLPDGRVIYMEHQPRYTPEELQMYNQPGLYPPPTRYVSLHPTESASQGQNETDVPDSPNSVSLEEATAYRASFGHIIDTMGPLEEERMPREIVRLIKAAKALPAIPSPEMRSAPAPETQSAPAPVPAMGSMPAPEVQSASASVPAMGSMPAPEI